MIETQRLLLRSWREADRPPFAAMSADPEVMRHLGGAVDRAASDAVIDRLTASERDHGHTFWAVERKEDGALLGFCGLRRGGHPGTGVTDELEIGWRLARHAWGQGYAREAAGASIAWGWANRGWTRIYSDVHAWPLWSLPVSSLSSAREPTHTWWSSSQRQIGSGVPQ